MVVFKIKDLEKRANKMGVGTLETPFRVEALGRSFKFFNMFFDEEENKWVVAFYKNKKCNLLVDGIFRFVSGNNGNEEVFLEDAWLIDEAGS